MNNTIRIFALGLGLGALSALTLGCFNFRANDRVSEMEFRSGGSTNTWEYKYDDSGRLEEVEVRNGGDLQARLTYTYEDGKVSEIELDGPNQDPLDVEVTWEGSLPSQLETKNDSGGTTWTITFKDGDITRPEKMVQQNEDSEGNRTYTITTEYTYDDSGNVERMETTTEYEGTESASETRRDFKYDEDGRMEEAVHEDSSGDEDEFQYSYDDDGRLDEVDPPSGPELQIKYDDDGRIEEIDADSSGDIEFTYEDGSVNGVTHSPPYVPNGNLFDMRGRNFGTFDGAQFGHLLFLFSGN
jgi:YD repeat-containing protein